MIARAAVPAALAGTAVCFALAATAAFAAPAAVAAPAEPTATKPAGKAGPAARTLQRAATGTKAAPAPGRASATERTALIAVLDKRLGTTADFTLKPGERFAFGRISGVLRTCERTQPFERTQSAAFIQVAEQPPAAQNQPAPPPKLLFSGWLFAESPSLNPFVHPVYDVWLKSCTMRFPDGPRPPSTSAGKKKPSPARAPGPPASASQSPAPAATPPADSATPAG